MTLEGRGNSGRDERGRTAAVAPGAGVRLLRVVGGVDRGVMFGFDRLWWIEPTRVFCARRGRSELTTIVLTESGVRDTVERMLRVSGRRVDVTKPERIRK